MRAHWRASPDAARQTFVANRRVCFIFLFGKLPFVPTRICNVQIRNLSSRESFGRDLFNYTDILRTRSIARVSHRSGFDGRGSIESRGTSRTQPTPRRDGGEGVGVPRNETTYSHALSPIPVRVLGRAIFTQTELELVIHIESRKKRRRGVQRPL